MGERTRERKAKRAAPVRRQDVAYFDGAADRCHSPFAKWAVLDDIYVACKSPGLKPAARIVRFPGSQAVPIKKGQLLSLRGLRPGSMSRSAFLPCGSLDLEVNN